MIDCNITKGTTSVKAEGSLPEITAEVAAFINSLYSSIDAPGLRDFFRITMTRFVTEEDSPLWKVQKKEHKFSAKPSHRSPFFWRGKK